MANKSQARATWLTNTNLLSTEIATIDENAADSWNLGSDFSLTDNVEISLDTNSLSFIDGTVNFESFPTVSGETRTDNSLRCAMASPGSTPTFDNLGSTGVSLWADNTTNDSILNIECFFPNWVTLSNIKVAVRGSTTGALPTGAMAVATLYSYTIGAYETATATVATKTDDSASNAAYVADHLITFTGLTEQISPVKRYNLQIRVPTHANKASGFRVYHVWYTATAGKIQH